VRNAGAIVRECLVSAVRSEPEKIIVVDGESTDGTLAIVRQVDVTLISDEGRGLPVARMLGAEAATTDVIALVDADVILPDGALAALLEEFERGDYVALQAGLESIGGGYWGAALADHHRTGRSRYWFGLVATVIRRRDLLDYGFDSRFESGEDIDLRWRLRDSGARIGVSRTVMVTHRFADDSWEFARGQFVADGAGLGRMVRTRGIRGIRLTLLPSLAAIRGIVLSLIRMQPRWIPYYVAYATWNYRAMAWAIATGR
jgi:glycosyltransferase involved in cell wall biosynthesis